MKHEQYKRRRKNMKMDYEKKMATRIKVCLHGDVNEYAQSFLAIYNNVKSDHDLLKMYNDYHDGVYVVCETDVKDAAIKFLEQFGVIERVEIVEVVVPMAYDYDYSDEYDTEFLAVDEI
jgi:hypothetical protein